MEPLVFILYVIPMCISIVIHGMGLRETRRIQGFLSLGLILSGAVFTFMPGLNIFSVFAYVSERILDSKILDKKLFVKPGIKG